MIHRTDVLVQATVSGYIPSVSDCGKEYKLAVSILVLEKTENFDYKSRIVEQEIFLLHI